MAELVWGELDQRFFETGVSKGVLYIPTAGVYSQGVAWNGLTNVSAAPTGAEPNKQYADNINYVTMMSAEEFAGTIECFTFPNEFLRFNGVAKTANGLLISQQARPMFGFSWRSEKGNAEEEDLGYVINLAYGLQSSPAEASDATKNESPELKSFSFSVTSTPVNVAGYRPTSHLKIDSTDPDVDPAGLAALEEILYGTAALEPRLPLPTEIDSILAGA